MKTASQPALHGKRILLVEDAPDNQYLVTRILEIAGASVEVAGNGRIGIEKALSGTFDLVLMDIQMPEVDGYTATSALRSSGYAKPIVALTAHALYEERQKCLRSGFSEHLAKPIDRPGLIATIKFLCEEASI